MCSCHGCGAELEAIPEYAQTFIARPQYQARLGLYLFESFVFIEIYIAQGVPK
jgi:hypothetical protein